MTVRPVGDPAHRAVRIGQSLARFIRHRSAATDYLVVDEGPGLSGSSMACVADWLEGQGVAPHRIHFFPGHAGDPGPLASDAHRRRWRITARHVTPFDAALAAGTIVPDHWFEPRASLRAADLVDLSAGRWRERCYGSSADWPAANLFYERRKYLYQCDGERWLARFVGLGDHGRAAFRRARILARHGFTPPVRELRYGFLIGRWLDEAKPLNATGMAHRSDMIEQIAAYLAFLARHMPARDDDGADPAALFAIAHENIRELLGEGAAAAFACWQADLPRLARRHRPIASDNRMHAWEWLQTPDGRLLKTDALDHHRGHDCIGAQDLAWEIAGAAAELALTVAERWQLKDLLALGADHRPDERAHGFYMQCYLAFQAGSLHLHARTHADGGFTNEADRLHRAAQRYIDLLRDALTRTAAAS